MMGSVRRVLALLLAHLTATVVATIALAMRRFIAYDVPLAQSLTPVRFLPHLLLGPVYAAAFLCEALCMRLGIEPPLHRRRVGFFTHHREFDIGKARRLLGYEPRVTLNEGLRRTAAWYAQAGLLAPLKPRLGLAPR
jgi:hypothetical protein